MAEAGVYSLRLNRLELRRLEMALALSLAAHLLAWGGYEAGKQFDLWQRFHWPAWLHHVEKIKPAPVVQNVEEPLEFVTVDQPSTEAPKNAKYYSSQNSRAANPDANRDTDIPQINGKQTDAPMTETILRPQFSKSQSEVEKHEANDQQANSETEPSLSAGDLTLGKPNDSQEQSRPRTLNQAYAMMANRMPSVLMKQEGGVRRRAMVSSFDVKLTGFGDYDERIVTAITQHWWDLLASNNFSLDRTGKVVLLFRLNYDGTISDMRFADNTVGDLLGYVCQKAVFDAAPFESFSHDMRLQLGDYRDCQFTFDYFTN